LIPKIETCLVCDLVRPELGGKLAILGFYGICPHVDIGLQHLDQPAVLTFVLAGGTGQGTFPLTVDIVDENQRVIASISGLAFEANPKGATLVATTLMLIFGHAGRYAVRCLIDQAEIFRAYFAVSQGRPL
jgi:hypothetical protein